MISEGEMGEGVTGGRLGGEILPKRREIVKKVNVGESNDRSTFDGDTFYFI